MFSLPFPSSTIDAVKTRRKHEDTEHERQTISENSKPILFLSLDSALPFSVYLHLHPPASATKAATFRSLLRFKLLISPSIIGIISLRCRPLNGRNLWFLRHRSWSLQDWQGSHIVGENSIGFIWQLV